VTTAAPVLSVIIPVYNGVGVLPHSLRALAASDLSRELWELIVVDDASTDDTLAVAAEFADTVVRLGGRPHGPSYVRNRGAEVARGDILVFVDADVCVHPDALRRFAWAFAEAPEVAAIFGSYDDQPAAPGLVSQYRNLLHHYVHQVSGGEADTFWAGCGAIRRAAFGEVGMYNEWHFSRPQIEDIELGHRLRDHGHRILLRPEIQGKHLKRWTFRNVLTTDLKDRGVPWTRLLIRRGQATEVQSLNLKPQQQLATAAVWLALVPPILALAFRNPRWLIVSAALIALVLVLNLPLYRFFRRSRGMLFALGVVPMHLVYYILNGISVMIAVVLHHTIGDPQPPASVQAFVERGLVQWPPIPRPAAVGASVDEEAADLAPAFEGGAVSPTRPERKDPISDRLQLAFRPLDKRAFGVAIGLAAGLLVAAVTVVGVVRGGEGARILTLLNQYFEGYSVSGPGVAIGFLWAFVAGFVGGWFVAFVRNFVFAVSIFLVRTRAELFQTRDFLDHV
jgi:hypothetical protein